nr:tail fiber domain-containing protein [uncultured Psychroserpens sp.]
MKKLINQKLFIVLSMALFVIPITHSQVGIGTTTPTAQLTVEEDAIFNESGGDNDFRIETLNRVNMIFVDAANDRIGIGINDPAYAFDMRVSIPDDYIATFQNTHATGSSLQGYILGTFNALGAVTNNANGLASYGVSLPATGNSLGVWGTSNSSDAIGVQGSIPTTGTWFGFGGIFTGALGYVNGLYNLSDERVKKDIITIENALSKIRQIRGVSYKYNLDDYNYLASGDKRTYLGFLAQNIMEVFPEAVAQKQLTVSGPDKMGSSVNMNDYNKEMFNVVDYTAIIPVLVEGIKEQQTIIDNQNTKIQDLEAKLLILESKINLIIESQN